MAAKLIDLEKRRYASMKQYAIKQALERLDAEHPGFRPEPCVALIAAYEEARNLSRREVHHRGYCRRRR